jgi:hypothetical protein
VWTVTLIAFLWFIAITVAYQVGGGPSMGPSWGSFSRSYTTDWSLIPDWIDTTAFLGISTSLGQSHNTFGPWLLCKYLLTCAFIGGITIDLHVVELLVQCSRDESLWRRAASTGGLGPSSHGAFHVAFTTWHQTICLFVFKTLIHWVFSLAFGPYWEGIEMRIPQVCYTAVALFLLSLSATYLTLWRPKGPQPATFGHLPTLIDLIDVWPCRMPDPENRDAVDGTNKTGGLQAGESVTLYWGDKSWNHRPDVTCRVALALAQSDKDFFLRCAFIDSYCIITTFISSLLGSTTRAQTTMDFAVLVQPTRP